MRYYSEYLKESEYVGAFWHLEETNAGWMPYNLLDATCVLCCDSYVNHIPVANSYHQNNCFFLGRRKRGQ